jgi:hypothetical protein
MKGGDELLLNLSPMKAVVISPQLLDPMYVHDGKPRASPPRLP